MSALTAEEIKLLEDNPATAAVAKKLKESQEIPKSRFDEVNEARKAAEQKLAERAAADEKAEKERLEKEGNNKALYDAEKKRADDIQKALEIEKAKLEAEKKIADQHRKMIEDKRAALKEKMGDAWLTIYDTAPLDDLDKISAQVNGSTSVIPAGGKPGFYKGKSVNEMTPAEFDDYCERVRRGEIK